MFSVPLRNFPGYQPSFFFFFFFKVSFSSTTYVAQQEFLGFFFVPPPPIPSLITDTIPQNFVLHLSFGIPSPLTMSFKPRVVAYFFAPFCKTS